MSKKLNLNKQTVCWIGLVVIGLVLKFILLRVKTGDYVCFLEPWLNFIKSHGYAASLKYNFYDYTPTYIYLLIGIAKTGLNPLFLVKLTSIIFEFITAYFIGKIAYLKFQTNGVIWASIAIVPLLPTVILNSSYLSQCDSIYTSFILGSIYFFFKEKQLLSVFFLGIAFALKIQTAIILPFFFVIMLRGYIKWYYFIIIPIVYILSVLPAAFYGRPFNELLGIYLLQSNHYKFLTLNFPNLYIWISNSYYEPVKLAGVLTTALTTLMVGLWLSKKQFQFTFELWIKLAFLSAITVPFLLPGMHERYMYVGDVVAVIYFIVLRKNIHLPIGILIVSFYSYIRCSRYNDILPMAPAFFIYLFVVIFTASDFISSLKKASYEISNLK
jgi:Gpi18-like mannosyltransferase